MSPILFSFNQLKLIVLQKIKNLDICQTIHVEMIKGSSSTSLTFKKILGKLNSKKKKNYESYKT